MKLAEITTCTQFSNCAIERNDYAQQTVTGSLRDTEFAVTPLWAAKVLSAAALLIVGTGGTSNLYATAAYVDLRLTSAGGADRIECAYKSRGDNEEERLAGSPEGLSIIQHYLSLNLSDVAIILHVTRPTIYSWLRDESTPHEHNIARIRQILKLAKIWSDMSTKRLGKYLKIPSSDGYSVFNLLSEENIDQSMIRRAFAICSHAVEHDASRPRARSAVEIANQFGFRPVSPESIEDAMAQETGF